MGVVLLRGILLLPAADGPRRTIDEAIKRLPHRPSGYDLNLQTQAAADENALEAMSAGPYDIADIMEWQSRSEPSLLDRTEPGDPLCGPDFPVVWARQAGEQAAWR